MIVYNVQQNRLLEKLYCTKFVAVELYSFAGLQFVVVQYRISILISMKKQSYFMDYFGAILVILQKLEEYVDKLHGIFDICMI